MLRNFRINLWSVNRKFILQFVCIRGVLVLLSTSEWCEDVLFNSSEVL